MQWTQQRRYRSMRDRLGIEETVQVFDAKAWRMMAQLRITRKPLTSWV
jgi:hypothetical protein